MTLFLIALSEARESICSLGVLAFGYWASCGLGMNSKGIGDMPYSIYGVSDAGGSGDFAYLL